MEYSSKTQKSDGLDVDLNETIDQLAMGNNVHWHNHVLKRLDCHILRMALDLEVERQGKKRRLKKIEDGC